MINEKNKDVLSIHVDVPIIDEKNKDVICAAPWSHLYMDTAGLVRPCCTQDIIYGDSNTTSIKDIWNSSEIIKFRKNLLAGVKQEGCKFCYQQEKHTGQSLRTGLNDKYGALMSRNPTPDMVIKYLDIRSSNLCNMACIMCGSEYSSLWHDDEVKLYEQAHTSGKFINITKETEKDIIENILSNNIDLVYFAGGEPLITPYHYELLEKLISMGISNDINLRYNTNLSTLKYKKIDLAERWSHFKSVEIAASIDMIGERAELHRYGTDWKKISNHLHTVRFDIPSVSLTPQITVTALSIGYLPELLTYFIDELGFTEDDYINVNIALWPEKLNPQLLPKSIKELYTNKLQSFLDNTDMKKLCKSGVMMAMNSMNEVDKSDKFEDMIDYLNQLDDIRPTNWKVLWPEIAEKTSEKTEAPKETIKEAPKEKAKFREFYVPGGAGSNFLASKCLWAGDESQEFNPYDVSQNEFFINRVKSDGKWMSYGIRNPDPTSPTAKYYECPDQNLINESIKIKPLLIELNKSLSEINKLYLIDDHEDGLHEDRTTVIDFCEHIWREEFSLWTKAFFQILYWIPQKLIEEYDINFEHKMKQIEDFFAKCREYYYDECNRNNWDMFQITHMHPYLVISPRLKLPENIDTMAMELDGEMDMYNNALADIKVQESVSDNYFIVKDKTGLSEKTKNLYVNKSVALSNKKVSYRKIFFENDENEIRTMYEFFDNANYFDENKTIIMKEFKEYHENNIKLVKKLAPKLYEQINGKV